MGRRSPASTRSRLSPRASSRPATGASPFGGHSCHGHAKPSLESILTAMRAGGLKITVPRRTLVQAILGFDLPFSAEDLHRTVHAKSKNPKCDLVTIYRTLASLEELKLISKVDLADGTLRFELLALDGSHHHHIVCLRCRHVEPITDCVLESQNSNVPSSVGATLSAGPSPGFNQERRLAALGYTQISHRLEFFGLCRKCSS